MLNNLTWDYITEKCDVIVEDIKSHYNLDEIELVGVARGGLIPATYIACHLGLRLKMLDIHTFDEYHNRGDIIDNDDLKTNKKIIIIDDIYDTGKTFNYIKEKYNIEKGYFIIDKREKLFDNDDWYKFPWEDK